MQTTGFNTTKLDVREQSWNAVGDEGEGKEEVYLFQDVEGSQRSGPLQWPKKHDRDRVVYQSA